MKLLLVVLAFALMVITTSFFISRMLRENLRKESINVLTSTSIQIESSLHEAQAILKFSASNIRRMIIDYKDREIVQEYLSFIGGEIEKESTILEFEAIFGYFDIFNGEFIHGHGWGGGDQYDPSGRPWYIAAVDAGGQAAISPLFKSARNPDHFLVGIAQQIFDDDGQVLGVICLNLNLDRFLNIVINMQIAEGGYGVLLSSMMNIIAHPNRQFLEQVARQINPGFSKISHELELGNDAFEHEFENFQGKWTLASTKRLSNGWVLILLTPTSEYYRDMHYMIMVISILGIIFAAALIVILLQIDLTRSRQKSLLTDMEKQYEIDKRTQLLLDATPLGCMLWDKDLKLIECNRESLHLFNLNDKQEFFNRFYELSPVYQPCGKRSSELNAEYVNKAFNEGYYRYEWIHQNPEGGQIPSEITLVRVDYKEDKAVAGYIRDLRNYIKMMKDIEQRDTLLNTVNHAASILLAAEGEKNIINSMLKGMELMGSTLGVDRVQIWQNEMIDGENHFIVKYQWLSSAGEQKKNIPIGTRISHNSRPEWVEKFLAGNYINSPFSELPAGDQGFLLSYDIKSIILIPLFLLDNFWGIFCLNDCSRERTFHDEEINILRSGGLLIANAFLQSEMTENIRSGAAKLEIALKEAQDANLTKSKFLATMSHEIRTPMNVILGVTESQISAEIDVKKAKESFEKIYDSGSLLLRIINDILDLSKIEAGKFELNPINYEILSLVNDAANMNIMQFGHKQVEFKLFVDENIPLYLVGDELRIKQVMFNLLSNAFKYTSVGEVILSFSVDNVSEDKTILIISVNDTGQGMTPDQVSMLFEEYSRFNLEANRSSAGSGLGMTITGNLVKMMNGMICVDSTPGKGSIFMIRIPQEVSAPGLLGKDAAANLMKFRSSMERKKKTKIVREPMPYGKVLVVDDMPSNIDVAKLLLKPYQLQIDTAESGFQAIDIVKSGMVYDIVFMDHMMPKMDGMETTKKMREINYMHPILALTANAVVGQKEIFLANGFDGFISKPIDIRQLNDALNKFIRDKERGRLAQQMPDIDITSYIPADDKVFNISGIDSEIGLALYGDDQDVYLSVLRSFLPNALTVIERLRNVTEDTLLDYAINVHGMKGISASIGAEKLREAAFELEMKAKANDIDGVLDGNEALIKRAELLTNAVQTWLKEHEDKTPKQRSSKPNRELLVRLLKSSKAYNMNDVDGIMDELDNYDYDTDASLIIWLKDKIDTSDFPAIVTRLSEYLGESI
jgi:signal transduction histidine kinase/CheY-like chemotaxis protein/PAS domain-containing protein